jgi:hypothetical protein
MPKVIKIYEILSSLTTMNFMLKRLAIIAKDSRIVRNSSFFTIWIGRLNWLLLFSFLDVLDASNIALVAQLIEELFVVSPSSIAFSFGTFIAVAIAWPRCSVLAISASSNQNSVAIMAQLSYFIHLVLLFSFF